MLHGREIAEHEKHLIAGCFFRLGRLARLRYPKYKKENIAENI